MPIQITTELGALKGRTVQGAARSGYGRNVVVRPPSGADHVGRIFHQRRGYVGNIYRIEGEPITPLSHDEALEVAGLVGDCMNWLGFAGDEQRRRLFAVVDNPSQETWNDAHSLIITDVAVGLGSVTLWENVLATSRYDVRTKIADAPWPSIPTRVELIAALQQAVQRNRETLTGQYAPPPRRA